MFIISFLNTYVFGALVPIFLILLGLFFGIRLKLFHILHPIKLIKSLFYKEKSQGVSSIKAVSLALAGTLGVGNMVGVASAIALGGFGAVFWMWISAFVAMILKYSEIVLAMLYRKFDKQGRPYGGAMYYIKECFKNNKFGVLLASIFAFLCVVNSLSMGSMIQVSASASAAKGIFGIPKYALGLLFAILTVFAMKKGTSGVLGFTNKLVPFMTLGFFVLSLAVVMKRPKDATEAFVLICENAFSLKSGASGVFGFLISKQLRYGTMRGILSNEAGCGTAPAAHAVSSNNSPARQGVWGIFEVFADTIVLCTMTALAIIIGRNGVDFKSTDYMMMTVDAYCYVLGDFAGWFICVSVILFGLATVLCWGYYGMESFDYLFKRSVGKKLFIALYSASVFTGAVLSSNVIWEIADLCIGAMTLINLTVLLMMNKEIKRETEIYFG